MKTKIATTLFSIGAALGFAQEAPIVQPSAILPVAPAKVEAPSRSSLVYVQMGVADADPLNKVQALPGLGIGYRLRGENSSFDFAVKGTRQKNGEGETTYFYALPRVSYLRYLSAAQNQSFYLGAGMAWGGVKEAGSDAFTGIIPSLSVGYEMNRLQSWGSFIQLDVSQPAISTQEVTSFQDLPKPLAELAVGLGF
jgi:hypothetical protein